MYVCHNLQLKYRILSKIPGSKNNSKLDCPEIFRVIYSFLNGSIQCELEVFSASFVVLFVRYRPHFCYELPCEFTAAICVRGVPSVPMNRPAEHHHQGAKPGSLSIASIVTTPVSNMFTSTVMQLSTTILRCCY